MEASKEFIAAAATPLVLSILSHGDSYGYEIIQRVKKLSGGQLEWSDGMLYPILHRLERRELVSSYWSKSDSGRRRKYYRLKKQGTVELDAQRRRWETLNTMLERLKTDLAPGS